METKIVKIGNKVIGGGNPILIQSMTNTKTENVADTVAQINALTDLGCDIIRCAVPTMEAARALKDIKKQISIPLVADIHFDYKLAIAAIENGADKIRINPGNIGSAERVKAVVDVLAEAATMPMWTICKRHWSWQKRMQLTTMYHFTELRIQADLLKMMAHDTAMLLEHSFLP